jgi:hypothetical protein
MKIAIMQPTYLPWAGYFNLISHADAFVILDDVQFAAHSWQQRNRIIFNGDAHTLTVAVQVKGRPDQLIREVQTDETQKWRSKHLSILRQAYTRHPHGKAVISLVESVLKNNALSLADITTDLIAAFCAEMGLNNNFARSSQLDLSGRKSEHVLAICQHFAADAYLSAAGSREYIEEEGLLQAAGVHVFYQAFNASPYQQMGTNHFISHMSIVDVVANLGFNEARKYVDSSGF